VSDYRRSYVAGGTYFFALVTYNRRPILTADLGRRYLREAILTVKDAAPFDLFSICLLPNHLHTVWMLPRDDTDYSTRWKRIKHEFTSRWLSAGGTEAVVTTAERKEGRRGVWQPRYWEHTIRDEKDLERCVDYIHWNPRKHGLVRRVQDWPYSTFHRFVREGQYEPHWGSTPASIINSNEDWGEPT
jgi:putative transposase